MTQKSISVLLSVAATLAWAASLSAAAPSVVLDRVGDKVPDRLQLAGPADVQLTGFLGARILANEKNRLLKVDEDRLLAGFRNRPGEQAWIGEHVGKWLHAATLAWVNTGDAALRTKLDRVVAELLKTQGPDGYLGTYTADKRFGLFPNADWDVWVHKYNLIGLLAYYRFTRNEAALTACRKMGDLLIATFGAGKKSILTAGTHVGMASTSVLEPVVLLYRLTGEQKYLEFARYLVEAWGEPKGPAVLQTLLTRKRVHETANGKAYEMLSNLVGLCELYRVTGEATYLQAAVNAWEDVSANQLYITGSASHHEHFHAPPDLPNSPGANVGETCVTVTWIQLNAQLLRLTGEARYGDEIEKSAYNHLAGAQRPDGEMWCYYTALSGTKPYGPGINCCVSSGPRGMALLPQVAFMRGGGPGRPEIIINLFDAGKFVTQVGSVPVTVELAGTYPASGSLTVRLGMAKPTAFGLRLRSPASVRSATVRVSGPAPVAAHVGAAGWFSIPARRWKDGDRVEVSLPMAATVVAGTHSNQGREAYRWGPLVMAFDEAKSGFKANPAVVAVSRGRPAGVMAQDLSLPVDFRAGNDPTSRPGRLVPFALAGATGSRYQVWLRTPGQSPKNESLLLGATEARSRAGNVVGSIVDDDPGSFVVTWNGAPADQDWYSAEVPQPVRLRRVVYQHGRTFHDGGWFDATRGKPWVEVRRSRGGPWEKIGVLAEYPDAGPVDSRGIRSGQAFTLRLDQPVEAVAVRIVGYPAGGDNPGQAFSSCAELQAFAD